MINVYIYVLDTLADWEIGYVSAELNSKRFFKNNAHPISLQTVSHSNTPIKTMGGLTIIPDCLVDDIVMNEKSLLILPGANTWSDPKHNAIIKKASELLDLNACICAICGATVALANFGLLNKRPHTSNGLEYLKMFSPAYQGHDFYVEQPSIADHNLITANPTASLLWAKQIIEYLDVFEPDTLEFWFQYFDTGDAKYFFHLMDTLPSTT